jgi:hypothetical protein
MSQFVYMNHRIKDKNPKGPVIVAQDDLAGPRVREANEFELWFHGTRIGFVRYVPTGLEACETHDVKAWVELDDLVQIVDPKSMDTYVKPAPVATAKRPGRKVKT